MATGPRRRFGADVLLAVLLPVACGAAVWGVRPDRGPGDTTHPPTTSALSTASVGCPSALTGPGTDILGLSALPGTPGQASGTFRVGLGTSVTAATVTSGRVTDVTPGSGPAVVTGTGPVAPGVVAGRSLSQPLAATDCGPARGDQWFTGVGAGATHDSVLELVNPNSGAAQADVSIWSGAGPVEVDALRGVSVAGGSSVKLDLGKVVPRRGELALQVHTDRGQLMASVSDVVDPLGDGHVTRDWLPAQAAPATSDLLLGLASGTGERTLLIANPGTSEVRATVKILTATSVFAPTGVDEVRVAPGSTASLTLSDLLEQQTTAAPGEDQAIGLLVTATGPVTTALRQVVDGDLADLAGTEAISESSAVVVPTGPKQLLLAGPSTPGSADLAWYDADGTALGQQSVDLTADSGADVTVPAAAVLVTVTPQHTAVHAAVIVTGTSTGPSTSTGVAVVPFRELLRFGLVPDVRPGLP